MSKNDKIKDEKIKKKLKDILIPELIDIQGSQIELLNNKEAIIEGCKGILEYDENTIRLNLGKMSVKFMGDNLSVKSMSGDNIILQGVITTIEFLN
ncbi:MAG: YabP/YqfC family sporulation protein [Oscillospiraceae bacterium]